MSSQALDASSGYLLINSAANPKSQAGVVGGWGEERSVSPRALRWIKYNFSDGIEHITYILMI